MTAHGDEPPMRIGRGDAALPLTLCAALTCLASPASAQLVEYYHTDLVGNVRAVTDEQKRVIERHDYLPFGEECTTGPCASNPGLGAGQPRKFTGKERDTESGLDYFGARYYGSTIGRFTTVDPEYTWQENLTDPQLWNRYAYARNDPLRYVDPDGRKIVLAAGSSGAFKTEFTTAITYLNKGKASSVISQLEKRSETITVKEGAALSDVFYDPSTNTITWNPYSALKTTGGKTQSPALGLLHEADHALEEVSQPARFKKNQAASVTAYDNLEEKRVIKGTETRAAKKLGEGTRTDHRGTDFKVKHADEKK